MLESEISTSAALGNRNQKTEIPRGFKQTEVGMIPEDWTTDSLENLSDKIMVGIASAATHAYRDRGVILFRNQNIKGGILEDLDILHVTEEYELVYKNKRLKGGDLLTARTGYPGATCIVPDKYTGCQSFTTLITRPRHDKVNVSYLNYFINSEVGQYFFEVNQIGGGQKNVNAGTLESLIIPLPPTLREQQAIAEALSDMDAMIRSLEGIIEKKKAIKQGTMQKLLKPKEGWVERTIGEITDKITGGGTPSRSVHEYWKGEIPWVTVKDFASFDPNKTQEYITPKGLNSSSSNLIPENTIITATRIALGQALLYNVDVSINQDLKALYINKLVHNRFLRNWINHHEEEIFALGSGSTVMGISLGDFKKITITLPNVEEQIKISETIELMQFEIEGLERKLTKARQLKQGMMQELLTGKKRLEL